MPKLDNTNNNNYKVDRATNRKYQNLLQNEISRIIKWSHFVEYTSSGLSVQTYRINSLYDPDYTGAGTQPVGFDEIAQIYDRWRVEKVRIKITVVNSGTAAITAVTLSSSSTVPTQITAMAANNSSRAEMIAGTGQNRSVFIYDVNIKDWFGFKENVETDLMGTLIANPARVLYMHIGMEEIDLSAKAISLFTEFEFYTRFMQPVQLNNS
jgi:hypothetical protein